MYSLTPWQMILRQILIIHLITDLFLYCYESRFIAKLLKYPLKRDKLHKCNNTLTNLSFENFTPDIYPKEKLTSLTKTRLVHLFLIQIVQQKIETLKLIFIKQRDDNNFLIVNSHSYIEIFLKQHTFKVWSLSLDNIFFYYRWNLGSFEFSFKQMRCTEKIYW